MAAIWAIGDANGTPVRVIKVSKTTGKLRTGAIWPDATWEVLDAVFTEREMRVLRCMSRHLQWNTNRVVDKHGQYLTAQHLADLIPMDRSNLHKTLRSLRTKNAVIRVEVSVPYWVVNPELCFKGHVTEDTKRLFRADALDRRVAGQQPYYTMQRHRLTIMHAPKTN